MSFNQKSILFMTILVVCAVIAIAFILFDPPYSPNFWIGFSAIMVSLVLFGAFWIQQIAKADSVLPTAIGVWALNAVYCVFALATTVLTWMNVKYYALLHVVGFAVFVVAHLMFRMAEHHVEEMSKGDEPEQKIEKSKVTWR